ncbi:MAG: hypothetical protein JJT96_18885 [Opitutales bacterium]|nr:hypothetical protein [Opitutales bacterium]
MKVLSPESEVSTPALSLRRLRPVFRRHEADGNIRAGHPAERAPWIWAPSRKGDETAFLRFSHRFAWEGGPLVLHLTADHRYQFFLNGELLSCGPDRSDVAHWAVTTLEIELPAGHHEIVLFAWYIAEDAAASRMDPKHAEGDLARPNPPMAQMSHRAGLLLAGGDGVLPALLDTGRAAWRVADLTEAVMLTGPQNLGYHDIGPAFAFDMACWQNLARKDEPAQVVARPPVYNHHGIRNPGWVLCGTDLPEQRRLHESPGRIRAVRPLADDDALWQESPEVEAAPWNRLLQSGETLTLPPRTRLEVIWDLDKYECGYPDLGWSGGAGAEITCDWAESFFEVPPGEHLDAECPRGHRDAITGKRWLGFGDHFIASGAEDETSPALWWRAGRYLRLRFITADAPLRLQRVGILTTGYPFHREAAWTSSDGEWDALIPLLARGLELNAHEIWADCPYYEQMMYVGDNLMHALSNYVAYRDDRLSRRTLELLDWSRAGSRGGLVAERYPAGWRQEATTFAMLFPAMLRNYLYWRDDPAFVRERLPGMRQLIESLLVLRQPNGLLGTVPGWPFIDWVPIWHQGCGPGVREGDSSIVNFHLVRALQAAADVEAALGEDLLAQRYAELARQHFDFTHARYWSDERGLYLDTSDPQALTSEHAQVLALLTGFPLGAERQRCLDALRTGTLDARTTIYFSHYLLEVFAAHGEADAFFERLSFWRDLPKQGFRALPEMPDPCRSDCHGWGAHPLFHTFASIAGIRPSSAGFATVRIQPMPGPLTHFKATCLHPRGEIRVEFQQRQDRTLVEISLPKEVQGEIVWNGETHAIGQSTQLSLEPWEALS